MKKAIIGIVIAIVLVAAVIPVAYAVLQRATVTSLKFHFNKLELTNVEFSDTSSSRSIQQVFDTFDNPSSTPLTQAISLRSEISSISSPESFVIDMVANTKLTFSMFVDVENPTSFEAAIDRASVKASINNRELPTVLSISQQARIPAGGQSTIELKGITLIGKEIASMLVNLASNDFILTLDFGITSYFPTLLGEVPVPAELTLDAYLIPPKPSFDATGDGLKQVSFNSNSYDLTFKNDNAVPLTGKFQIGVLKGNSLLGVDICDPACLPIDSGIINFIRLNLGRTSGIEVFEKDNVSINPGESFSMNVENPELRNKENSAFIIRWNPDYSKIPYVLHSEIAGIQSSRQGEFSSQSLITVKKIAYNLVRDFGYVGSKEFVSPDTSTFLSLDTSTYSAMTGSAVELTGRLTDLAGNGVAHAQIYIKDDDTFSGDDNLGSAFTDANGRFSYTWFAETTDFLDNSVDLFVTYDGSSSYSDSRSQTIHIVVSKQSQPQKTSTMLSFESSSFSTYENDRIIFTGKLETSIGIGVSNVIVQIKDDDTGSGDDEIASVTTGTDGSFTVYWDARQTDPFDDVVEAYAVFEGNDYYVNSRSNTIEITVYSQQQSPPIELQDQFQTTSIAFEASDTAPSQGQTVKLSGKLTDENGEGVSGVTILVKDADFGSGDDLIASITTNSDGRYSFDWIAKPTDPFDNVAELYALFEGSALYGQARSEQIDIQVI